MKNKKIIMIGSILLIVCLIIIVLCLLKISVKENKKDIEYIKNIFLNKYELENNTSEEIEINGNVYNLKREENDYLFNGKKIKDTKGVYISNEFIIAYNVGQYGYNIVFYNLNGDPLYSETKDKEYENIVLDAGKVLIDDSKKEVIKINKYEIWSKNYMECSKTIKDNKSIINDYGDSEIISRYEIIYQDGEIKLNKIKDLQKLKDLIKEEDYNEWCYKES